MVTASTKQLNDMQQQITQLRQVAEASDAKIIEIINAQASHMQKLTKVVIAMHKKLQALFPEYASQQLDLEQNDPQNKPLITLVSDEPKKIV